MSIRLFYDHWPQYNRRLTEVVGAMTDEQLAIRPAPERRPIWATVGHTAGARVYWLCAILGEPGAETMPFDPTSDVGWEDDLDHPRGAQELRPPRGLPERSCDDLARRLVRADHDASGGDLAFDELQPGG